MPIPLGILAAAGARQAAGATFQLLESTVLTSPQAAVEFTNLTTKYAATYQHLQIRLVGRCSLSGVSAGVYSRLNGDTGNNYNGHFLLGNGSTTSSGTTGTASEALTGLVAGNIAATNEFGPVIIDLLDPFETTKNKTFRTLSGVTSANRIDFHSGLWMNTASVATWSLRPETFDWLQNTRVSLYGIRSVA